MKFFTGITRSKNKITNIAIQSYPIRKLLHYKLGPTLQAIKDLGIENLELSDTGGNSLPKFVDYCNRIGINIIGIHYKIPLSSIDDIAKVAQISEKLKYVTLIMDPTIFIEEDDASIFNYYTFYANKIKELKKKLSKFNIVICHHCYYHDYVTLKKNRCGLKILTDLTSPSELLFEIDTYFLNLAQLNLKDLFGIIKERGVLFHLRDVDDSNQEKPIGDGTIIWQNYIKEIDKLFKPSWYIIEEQESDVSLTNIVKGYSIIRNIEV